MRYDTKGDVKQEKREAGAPFHAAHAIAGEHIYELDAIEDEKNDGCLRLGVEYHYDELEMELVNTAIRSSLDI